MDFSSGDFADAETVILWDLVECPIPTGLNAKTVIRNIIDALEDMGYRHMISSSIRVYCHIIENGEALEGIPMRHFPAEEEEGLKYERRTSILVDLLYEAVGEFKRMNLMLMTGDLSEEPEFLSAFRFLQLRGKFNVLLAQHLDDAKEPSKSLLNAVRTVWRWSSLAIGGYPIGVVLKDTDEEAALEAALDDTDEVSSLEDTDEEAAS